jgi:multidrug transporter EmrE-like cation transporter
MIILASLLAHMGLSTLANICWKLSAGSRGIRRFLGWQIGGHLAGFTGVLVYTSLLKHLPIGQVFPVVQGLSVLAVQVLAAGLFFRERIPAIKWVGTGLIICGIVLVSIAGTT